jgi:hypothetical protein
MIEITTIDQLVWLRDFDVSAADEGHIAVAWQSSLNIRHELDVVEFELARRLIKVTSSPESALADMLGVGFRKATRLVDRVRLVSNGSAASTLLAQAFREGHASLAHLDVFLAAHGALEPELRQEFLDDTTAVDKVSTSSVRRFAARLRLVAERCRRRRGLDQLQRQRRQTHLRTWLNSANGMWHVAGAFDPETALELSALLQTTLDGLLAAHPVPPNEDASDHCDRLRARALADLITGHAPTGARGPEVLVVVDTTQRNEFGEPVVDWGLPVELPLSSLVRFFERQPSLSVVDIGRNGRLIDRTDRLELGRETRLANRAQRRALRGLHATCVVPGCSVPFQRCEIHHIVWWRNGGATDLGNLAPVCPHHHHRIREGGWVLSIDAQRVVRVERPDGRIMTTGPPPMAAA